MERQPNKPALFEFLERLRKAKKRFVVVTTAMGSVEEKDWDTIKAEKRRLMQAFGRPTELNAHADAFISAAGKVALFSCHIDSVMPVQGINELLLCVLASLPRNRGALLPYVCRVGSCRVGSCRVVSCRVVSCRVVSCRVVSCRWSCRVVGRV
jgi:hypothetical protein